MINKPRTFQHTKDGKIANELTDLVSERDQIPKGRILPCSHYSLLSLSIGEGTELGI